MAGQRYAPDPSTPITWPTGLYELIAAGERRDVLAVCTAHAGVHAVYLGACHSLPPQERPSPPDRPLTTTRELVVRVELDPDAIADGLVLAIQRARADQWKGRRR